MAFLRFTRDKRGYENFYLVETTTNRRGKTVSRVLYWFRTPPDVKVGRAPFDETVRQALEAQNPGVTFDWRRILDTPIPSAETERWRERRRVERAERLSRRRAEGTESDMSRQGADSAEADLTTIETPEDEGGPPPVDEAPMQPAAEVAPLEIPQTSDRTLRPPDPAGRRRRRRRRRRGRSQALQPPEPDATAGQTEADEGRLIDRDE